MNQKISIIIPVYNSDLATLHNCIESLQKQRGKGYTIEAIIVFDGEPNFEVPNWSSSLLTMRTITIKHSGVSIARNTGLRIATGQWIMFLDADDTLTDNAITSLLHYAIDSHCDLVMGAYRSFIGDRVEEHHYSESNIIFTGSQRVKFQQDMLRPQQGIALAWAKLYQLNLLRENQTNNDSTTKKKDNVILVGFDERLSLGEDAEFAFRAGLASKKPGYINTVVYEYRRNSQSAVRSFKNDYALRTTLAVNVMSETVSKLANSYNIYLDDYALFHLTILMINYIFNPFAPWDSKERKKRYKEVINEPVFQTALRHYHGGHFPITRQIALFSMKFHLYYISSAIAWIRHRQFNDAR